MSTFKLVSKRTLNLASAPNFHSFGDRFPILAQGKPSPDIFIKHASNTSSVSDSPGTTVQDGCLLLIINFYEE